MLLGSFSDENGSSLASFLGSFWYRLWDDSTGLAGPPVYPDGFSQHLPVYTGLGHLPVYRITRLASLPNSAPVYRQFKLKARGFRFGRRGPAWEWWSCWGGSEAPH